MGALDRFEKAVSAGVNGGFSRLFASSLKLVDVRAGLREEVEDSKSVLSDGRAIVANQFVITLNPEDLSAILSSLPKQGGTLEEELEDNLVEYAIEQSYVFVGPISITLDLESGAKSGELRFTSEIKRGPAAPVTSVIASPTHPIIDIGGKQWLLTQPVTVLGRGSEADIVINDTGVSRKHLEFRITPQGVIATDLGSTNGTYVEGNRIGAATLLDGNEITIGRTRILFWTSSVENYQF